MLTETIKDQGVTKYKKWSFYETVVDKYIKLGNE